MLSLRAGHWIDERAVTVASESPVTISFIGRGWRNGKSPAGRGRTTRGRNRRQARPSRPGQPHSTSDLVPACSAQGTFEAEPVLRMAILVTELKRGMSGSARLGRTNRPSISTCRRRPAMAAGSSITGNHPGKTLRIVVRGTEFAPAGQQTTMPRDGQVRTGPGRRAAGPANSTAVARVDSVFLAVRRAASGIRARLAKTKRHRRLRDSSCDN